MKFQKLTIHNIASIEDTVIDFEAKPLVDSEVFLITGKTGAGKSTILDSICLALYATTPRFENTKMQGEADEGERVNDPRQLMRRNTGEAYVRLTFIGSNGVHYEAEWSVKRARNKPDGKLQSKSWKLKNLDSNTTLEKDAEIRIEITTAIGLDFNQFCRTTMLAQGEFTRFLNSKDEEKADILEKITGMDIYTKIGKKIYDITNHKKEEYTKIREQIEGIDTLSETQIDDKKKEIEDLDTKSETKKKDKENAAAKREWLSDDAKLDKDVEKAKEQLSTSNTIIESEEFKNKEKLINEWNETIEVRASLKEVDKAISSIEKQKIIIDNLTKNFGILLGGYQTALGETLKTQQEINEIDNFLTSEKDRENVYNNVQTIVSNLNIIDEGRRMITNLKNEITNTQKLLDENYLPAYKDLKEKETNGKNDIEKQDKKVKECEKAVNDMKMPELRQQNDATKDLIRDIDLAIRFVETLVRERKRMEDKRKELAERLESIEEDKKISESMIKPIEDAKLVMDAKKEDLDIQVHTVDEFAKSWRSRLHKGEVCPVCLRKIETQFNHEDEISRLVDNLKKRYQEADNNYNNLIDKKKELDAKINSELKTYENEKTTFDKDDSVSEAEKKALGACAKCGVSSLTDSTPTDLEAKKGEAINIQKVIESKIKDGEAKEKELKGLRDALERKREDVEKLNNRIKNAEDYISKTEADIKTKNEIIKTKNDDIKNAENHVNQLVGGVTLTNDWHTSPNDFASELKSTAKVYSDRIEKRKTLAERYNLSITNCNSIRNAIEQVLATYPEWQSVEPTESFDTTNLLGRVNRISTDITQASTELKSAQNRHSEYRNKVDEFLSTHENLDEEALKQYNNISSDDIESIKNDVTKAKDSLTQSTTLLKSAQDRLAKHQEKKPVLGEDDTITSLNQQIEEIDEQINSISESRGAINKELKDDMERKEKIGSLMEEREKKKMIYDDWDKLNSLIGDSTGKAFRKIAQSYVLANLIRSANTYMKTLTDRYTLKVKSGTFVISIEDAYQGYVSRAASTISGGESFLVSLSLALALSDTCQTLCVDTLFIDEGFGTLSGEPLQNAVNTLRSLHNNVGRHVGIISHVEELQERIPVQIRVIQVGMNSSSKVVIT